MMIGYNNYVAKIGVKDPLVTKIIFIMRRVIDENDVRYKKQVSQVA